MSFRVCVASAFINGWKPLVLCFVEVRRQRECCVGAADRSDLAVHAVEVNYDVEEAHDADQ